EASYYSLSDPVQDVITEQRLQIAGGFGTDSTGTAGYVSYTGIDHVNVTLGSGNDNVTFVTTPHGTTTSVDTGAGDDRVAVRSIDGDVNLTTQGGNDTIYVGSGAGFWQTPGFTNDKGDANGIRAHLTIDGGADGTGQVHDVVAIDDKNDSTPNMGVLT